MQKSLDVLFHFVKNFKKCINSNNLAARYNTDADFALHAHMIPALAFVSVQDLEAAFQELSDNSPPELQPVLDWLQDNCIGRRNRRHRRPPAFPQQMWNVHDRVVQQPRRSRPPAHPSRTPDGPSNALEVYRWT